jgi:hypothetical protein
MPNAAIVVGIQGYPELPPRLQGPKNDAEAFHAWVTSAGGVAPADAKLILDQVPPATSSLNATPTPHAVQSEFDRWEEIARASANGLAGDRLYIYLSGHGFGASLDDAALLMANATQFRTRHHIPGRLWADYFFAKGYFKEVLLFIDCCRERYGAAQLNGPGVDAPSPSDGARRFYGFAAKYGKLAVEKELRGQMHGVFTATLLDALNGGASEEDGRITGATLKAYLYENMKSYLSLEDFADDVAKEPDLYCDQPEDDFVIATVPPVTHEVVIPIPPEAANQKWQLFGEKGTQKFTKIAEMQGDATLRWKLELMRGTYQLIGGGVVKIVTDKGNGDVDVTNP